MNGDVSVGDVMTREFVGVSEGDAMDGVADLMLEAGVDGAVVLRGSDPVGTIEARHLARLLADDAAPGEVTAGEAMGRSVPTIGPDSSIQEAVLEFAGREPTRLVVVDGDAVVGTLSEHDVVAAETTRPTTEPAVEAPAGATGASEGDDRYSTQSVCEGCGSLAESLVSVNGQLLCADCREL